MMDNLKRRRRRWPWMVPATLLLAVAAQIAWSFRPLNTAEKALVGRWRLIASDLDMTAEFRPDRRCQLQGFPAGTWAASATSLKIRFPALRHEDAGEVIWSGPDKFHFGDNTFVRIPDNTAGR